MKILSMLARLFGRRKAVPPTLSTPPASLPDEGPPNFDLSHGHLRSWQNGPVVSLGCTQCSVHVTLDVEVVPPTQAIIVFRGFMYDHWHFGFGTWWTNLTTITAVTSLAYLRRKVPA